MRKIFLFSSLVLLCTGRVLGEANPQTEPVQISSVTVVGTNLLLRWEGAVPPFKLQVLTDPTGHGWRDFTYHIYTNAYLVPRVYGQGAMFRVRTIPDRTAPSLAGGLTVVPDSCQSVSLFWSSASDNVGGTLLRGYRIYRNGALLIELPTSTLSYQDRSVAASSSYNYEVSAIDNAVNESSRTPSVIVSTPACSVPNLPPMASAGVSRTVGLGQLTSFNGSGSTDPDGSIVAYFWNFGDGATASVVAPHHAYQAPGAYQVRLSVTDDGGATASATVIVTVTNQPPVARASASRTTGQGIALSLTAAASTDADGSIVSYLWSFGDGGTASGVSPSYTYGSVGNYTARLTVTDNFGASSSTTVPVTVTNRPPVAAAGPDQNGTVNAPLNFASTGSRDEDGTIASYVWTFGDGAFGFGATATHSYAAAGSYLVTLTVTDNNGATAIDTALAMIGDAPNLAPLANAGADQFGTAGVSIAFDGRSSADPDGQIVSYAWRFGDGATASGSQVQHTYDAAGVFVVSLTVTDDDGASAVDGATVVMAAPPNQSPVAAAGGNRAALVGQSIAFSGLGSTDADGTIVAYAWNFGDGATASGAAVNHSYAAAGVYTATLTVTDDDGAQATDRASVTVTAVPPDGRVNAQVAGLLPGLGLARDVELSGSLALVAGDYLGLSVVDVSQPSSPDLMGVGDFPLNAARVEIGGTRAVVTGLRQLYSVTDAALTAEQVNGFYVFDLSVPAHPHLVGRLEDAGRVFNGCALSGNYAFVAGGADGLLVVDLSNPAAPRIAATVDTPGTASSVGLYNSFAYVADGSRGVSVINVANPLLPVLVTTVDTPGNAKDVAVAGARAYVADTQYLLVFDLTNPAAPLQRGSVSVQGAVRVKAEGTMVFLAAGGNGLISVNAANPAAPVVASTQPPTGGLGATTLGLAVGSSTLFAANGGGGLGAVAKPAQPNDSLTLLSTLAEWNDGSHVALKAGLAAVAFTRATNGGAISWFGVRLYDVSNPTAPRPLGSFETNLFGFWQTAFYGDYLIGACGSAGLKVLDIRNPAAPTVVASLAVPGSARGLAIVGTRAYIAAGTEGLRIVDLTNPRAPVALGGVALSGNALSVAAEGTMVYVGGNTTFTVVDAANPYGPVARGSYATTSSDVQVRQGLAYVAGTSGGLMIFDVANPAQPKLRGQLLPPFGSGQTTVGLCLLNNRAFLANSGGGMAVVDISNPSAPAYRAAVVNAGLTRSVVAQDGWVFCSDSKATMTSVRLF